MSYPHQSDRSSVAVVVIPVKGCERSLPAFVKLAWKNVWHEISIWTNPEIEERSRVVLEGVR